MSTISLDLFLKVLHFFERGDGHAVKKREASIGYNVNVRPQIITFAYRVAS